MIAARSGAGHELEQLLAKTTEKFQLKQSELSKTKEKLRQARADAAKARAGAALKAKEAVVRARTKAAAKRRVTIPVKRRVKAVTKTAVPPDVGGIDKRRYDYIRNHAMKLDKWLDSQFFDGSSWESALAVLTYWLDHRLKFTRDLMINLELPAAIEAETVRHLQSAMSVENAAPMRNTTGMTWAGYRAYSLSKDLKIADVHVPLEIKTMFT